MAIRSNCDFEKMRGPAGAHLAFEMQKKILDDAKLQIEKSEELESTNVEVFPDWPWMIK